MDGRVRRKGWWRQEEGRGGGGKTEGRGGGGKTEGGRRGRRGGVEVRRVWCT